MKADTHFPRKSPNSLKNSVGMVVENTEDVDGEMVSVNRL
jgi:hypothetical protein